MPRSDPKNPKPRYSNQLIDWKRFGEDFKKIRKAKNITGAELSKKYNISQSTITCAEHGMPLAGATFTLLCRWANLNPFDYLMVSIEGGAIANPNDATLCYLHRSYHKSNTHKDKANARNSSY